MSDRARHPRKMGTRLAVAVSSALLVALAGCAGSTQEAGAGPSAAQESAYAESAPPLGDPVEFFLYTHCGVESLRLDGRWWHALSPMYGPDGAGSAPTAWGDPYEQGILTLDSEEHVTFEAEGTKVAFAPAQDNQPRRICR